MPSTYKLTYFNIKGLAEPIRFLFAYSNIPYEDNRIEMADWPKMKASAPFGQLPYLEIDGRPPIAQSNAICRYLAKLAKLAGDNDLEALEIDAAVDLIHDFRLKLASVVFYEKDEAIKKTKFADLEKETIPFYLDKLEQITKANNGHMACKKLTWADIVLASLIDLFNMMCKKDVTEGRPNLKKLETEVMAMPQIKAWVEKRPKTDF